MRFETGKKVNEEIAISTVNIMLLIFRISKSVKTISLEI
ncbi:protein of unknown function [Petrocella atlantisensis]|uniref:Uncharacterized protein n=1 Tax=Petrocella atlantisensis TaxID=2173034 RepID=A0A3P7PAE2_9FIRM|nr:protein of unknown function [Petrocella atlantisensis]